MALPRITQKEMTEREQRELKTLLDRARIAHGRVLTNSESNSIKKEYTFSFLILINAQIFVGSVPLKAGKFLTWNC